MTIQTAAKIIWLVNNLIEISKLHPFIAIVVGSFRAVIELHMKRRSEDKKIAVVLATVRDMMEALLPLRAIKDQESVGPDGQSIKARMQELIKQTAEDIRTCANTCDTYAKEKVIMKVIKASIWDGKLKGFINLFANRRKAFIIALSIHVGVLNDGKFKELDEKVDMVLAIFSRIASPEEQEFAALVQKRSWSTAVMNDDGALKELLRFQSATATGQAKHSRRREGAEDNNHQDEEQHLVTLKEELLDDPELAIEKNREAFERKFHFHPSKVLITDVESHEGDRVIEAVTAGPHGKILDPDIHTIWKKMRWPENVDVLRFVLTLCHYYPQEVARSRKVCHADGAVNRVADKDTWTLEWINVNRLQAIIEAFDDDASGAVTVTAVNYFTASRPKEWSLPHWLAYWAIGWQMAATKYRNMIVDICAKMFAIRPHIHPANRNAVDTYLHTVWQKIATLTSSFVPCSQSDSLQERFKSYVEAEEKRLREGLEKVRYGVDAMDALLLITGPGRIEKYLFPLLWLLLRRHFEIFRVCRHTVIHKRELRDSAGTILQVFEAITQRHDDLEAQFKQQRLNPEPQFRALSSELYGCWHNFETFWSLDNLWMLEFPDVEYNDADEDQSVDVLNKLLNYPSAPLNNLYPPRVEDSITENDTAADEAVRLILGRWNGIQIAEDEAVWPMITFCLNTSIDHQTYEASSVGATGINYIIFGDYNTEDDGTVEYSFTQTYDAHISKTYWTATLEDDGMTLSGRWGYEKDDQPWRFVFKRVPPEILVDRPHSQEFMENRIKTLWNYALTAVHNHVRRKLFSWSYLKERREVREKYLKLLRKKEESGVTDDNWRGFSVLHPRLTFDDVQCFYFLQDYWKPAVLMHFGIECANCDSPIHGTRVVCMECRGSHSTFDFCDKPACVGCTIKTRDDISSPHLPTHDFVKIRTPILHHREIGKVLRKAKAGLERARDLLEEAVNQKQLKIEENLLRRYRVAQAGYGEDRVRQDEDDMLRCLSCRNSIRQQCLYCIDCPEDSKAFICWDCDAREGGFSNGKHHLAAHNLVRCTKAQKEGELKSGDEAQKRFDALEDKLERLTSQMERIEKALRSLPNVPAE